MLSNMQSIDSAGKISLALVLLVVSVLVKYVSTGRKSSLSLPLPPGPPGLPLIGNIHKNPKHNAWEMHSKWSDLYGDVICLHGLGQHLVILNSLEAAKDLLDKKSAIYSNRPTMTMFDLSGVNEFLVVMSYTSTFKHRRRLIQQAFGTEAAVRQYFSHIEIDIKNFLKRLLITPHDYSQCLNQVSSDVVLHVTYGRKIISESAWLLESLVTALSLFVEVLDPTAFLVNFIPIMVHIPSWFPGTKFKKVALELRARNLEIINRLYYGVRENMANGTISEHSFTSSLIENNEDEISAKYAAGMIFGAGFGTSSDTMHAFFKAMLLHPEVQARAQAEIDAVIGNDRLPNYDDRACLPYVQALMLEVFRWHVVVPLGLRRFVLRVKRRLITDIGISHRAMEDDIYNGMRIPKGAIIMPNTIKFSMDPKLYKEPQMFEPLRFMPGSGFSAQVPEQDPRDYVFGHGRRMCAGKAFADASMFMEMAAVLACFNVTPYVDEEGKEHLPKPFDREPGFLSSPTPFKCQVKPRNAKTEALLHALEV
ncbi:cytochrome P450 [Fistulina hepatica ATCC 64428]|uniref:Cytochrome P450 n=1 Tax=Fistulina hepatica ATCC 64428 TaxID=1128425 RepID=A0A0D7A332_9AGAR|nr:cytochrome P450 [Fistulina hepatica ATCC 64428]KIY45150.1 cytochrome P450 [Fistulina hepatica ATCC 64428]